MPDPEASITEGRTLVERTLTVLGCDGSYPGPGGAGSGYLVRTSSTVLWLDAGPGTFANLQTVIHPAEVDAVVLSHEHPDHWTDIESLAVAARYALGLPPVRVYAPPGLRRRCYHADALRWETVEDGDRVGIGDLSIRFSRTEHGPTTLATRIDQLVEARPVGGGLAYTADTGPGWSWEPLGQGISLVLSEATYTSDREALPGHLSAAQAGARAREAEAERLVVTHRWPTVSAEKVVDEATATFGRPVRQAAIGEAFRW